MVLDPNDWLPSQADHIRERTERESRDGIAWTSEFSPVVRRKLDAVYDDHIGVPGMEHLESDLEKACLDMLRRRSRFDPSTEYLGEAITSDFTSSEELADWMAAIPLALDMVRSDYAVGVENDEYVPDLLRRPELFYGAVNDVLLEERVGWLYLHDRFRRREAQPLHLQVIRPMEALLTDDPRFEDAEAAYGEATNLLAQGHYGAAVTATYSAVQATFQALGATGGDLGALFASAKNAGFLVSADEKLILAVKGLTGWMTANRSARGNAHGASTATKEDAELSIHIAAALMLRLMQFPSDRAV